MHPLKTNYKKQNTLEANIPDPEEENIGYDVDRSGMWVVNTDETTLPELKIGILTTQQMSDCECLEQIDITKK